VIGKREPDRLRGAERNANILELDVRYRHWGSDLQRNLNNDRPIGRLGSLLDAKFLLARDRSCFEMFEALQNNACYLPVISFTCKDKAMVDRTLRRCEHSIGSNSSCE
jgi:hypothetical protein